MQVILIESTAVRSGRNQLSLAREAGTDVKMTSEVVRKLEAKSLLVRTVDAGDTRARRLRVTGRGAELARRAVTTVEAADAAFFRATPDSAALTALLRPLAGGSRGTVTLSRRGTHPDIPET